MAHYTGSVESAVPTHTPCNEERISTMGEDIIVLIAGMLHNVNNYLQAIVGNATLGMKSFHGCDHKEHFRVIQATADRCGEVIKQMISIMMSRKRESYAVDVRTVVSEIIEIFEPLSDDIMRISYSCEDIPHIYGNESDISQILLNLLFNAREAVQSNGNIDILIYPSNCKIQVSDNENNRKDFVCISVKDNGPGIPDNIKDHIFSNIKSSKKNTSHLGIGLAVSQLLAESHGGWIECAHTDKTGTEFVVYFHAFKNAVSERKDAVASINE